jgi:protein MBA1
MRLLRKRKGTDVYVWGLHDGAGHAARVLSIRAIEGNLSTAPPKIGNRLLVQALVKFDTMQVNESFLSLSGFLILSAESASVF